MSLCVSAIFQLFKVIMPENSALTILELNRNQRFGQVKIEHLSSYAHVVHTTAKKVISRRRKNENVFKMSKDEKCTCKACKNTVFHCQICKSVGFLLPSWLRRTHCFFCKYGNHSSFRSCNFRSTTAIRRSLRQRFLK